MFAYFIFAIGALVIFLPQILSQVTTDPKLANFQVRLTGGQQNFGRVEIFYDGRWGTVCDDDWGNSDAVVICNMIGYDGYAVALTRDQMTSVGAGAGPIWLDNVNCNGNENTILDCLFIAWDRSNCDHTQDAGVLCLGRRILTSTLTPTLAVTTTVKRPPTLPNCIADNSVRLINGSTIAAGRVEVNLGGVLGWKTICDDNWGIVNARVVCRMLCYEPLFARAHMGGEFGINTTPIDYDDVNCQGGELRIQNCPRSNLPHDCNVTEAAGVSCLRDTPTVQPPPSPSITCTPDEQISATFQKSYEPNLKIDNIQVDFQNADTCGSTRSEDANTVRISIPFVKCGTNSSANSTHITYSNLVRYFVPPTGTVITRSTRYFIPVHCVLPRRGEADKDFLPESQRADSQFGHGKFNVQMILYLNNDVSNPITDFPARLQLGDFLYVGISLITVDGSLKVIVPECKATTTSDPNSQPSYDFIKNKCKAESSVTYFPYNSTFFGFRLQSFKFFGDNFTQVYLHCQAVVCKLAEKNSFCDRSCGSRKKRNVVVTAPENVVVYFLDKGPFQFDYNINNIRINGGKNNKQDVKVVQTKSSRGNSIMQTFNVYFYIIIVLYTFLYVFIVIA